MQLFFSNGQYQQSAPQVEMPVESFCLQYYTCTTIAFINIYDDFFYNVL